MTDTKAAAGDAKIKEETTNKVEAGDNETKSPTDGGHRHFRRRHRSKPQGLKQADEEYIEAQFTKLVISLKKKFGDQAIASRVANYPEGFEFNFRVAKKAGNDGENFTSTFGRSSRQRNKVKQVELSEEDQKKLEERKAKREEKNRLWREKIQARREQRRLEREATKDTAATNGKVDSEKDNLNEKVTP
eukprot:TRINITY_DN31778_c0_g1_i1.p1 TRINITY_DN31778_c0_g1~~TRINITY_DN31778_c0_g1_i1.p1  ORF type:complete len:189 (-),score=77.88 TRINITY_DN31778_c0_g1_i1:125-691(-)